MRPKSKSAGVGSDAPPSNRPLKVGEMVRHALVLIFQRGDVHDLALQKHNLTITEVKMSPDLRHAHVFFTPFGGGDSAPLFADLKRCRVPIRTALARAVKLRFVPELHFQLDESFDHAGHIQSLLQSPDVARDLVTPEASAAPDADSDEA